ncbi:Neurotrypsin [Desmophyllum pertusum]|uniref:Neurotrypsin n=1 Tax=Desmophyllum pertusum TaxID=174260 RepID=A0A9W9Z913_9CNID|nr:Neurotrypsin [Desmophyllum pertusum]
MQVNGGQYVMIILTCETPKLCGRMLNHSGAVSYGSAYFRYGYGTGSDDSQILLDNLKCRGDEASLMECKHKGWGNSDCGHFEDVAVVCKNDSIPTVPPNVTSPTIGPPANFTIRLRGGDSEHAGRVEIVYNGTVGTICDNDFDIDDANVICKMLGFKGAWSTMCCGRYGYGYGSIWLDNLQCTGNETTLSACPHLGWGNHDDVCSHYNDAGVFCIPKPVVPPDARKMLLFSEYSRSILFQAYLEGDVYQAAPLPFDNIHGLTAVGFDPIERQVYYGQFRPGLILRSPLNGSAPETIINGVYFINRLAIDYVFRIIYFTDTSRDRIDVATLEGKYRKRLISTPAPEDIALDLENGTIYWTSNGYPPRIERADMDGENVIVIRNLTDDSYLSGITFDSSQKRLYWTDRNVGEVYYIDLVTNRHGTFISHELYDPIDLAILGNKLYVTDSGSGEWDGGIYSALLGGSEPRGCQLSDRKCSHLCLNSPDEPHCTCPNGMRLINATTCVYRTLLLYTECFYSEIYKAPLGGDDLFSVASSLALENPSCPSAIASNPATDKYIGRTQTSITLFAPTSMEPERK